MQYRRFGSAEWPVSALGFGCMRLPTTGKPEDIDEAEATRMLRHAIDHGVNYVDTAYGYHGGNSEWFVGRALQDGYRERLRLVTKLPPWKVETAADFDRLLNEQLEKLQADHLDVYLLHSLDRGSWRKLRDLGVREWARKPLSDGRVGRLGFSFHDEFDVFKEIVDAYDWTCCQIQYNYMDIENQAGTKGLRYAAEKGLAVIVMEPLLGGRLVDPPPAIQKLWATAPVQRSPADWALQWLWSQPEVSVVLSGMSTFPQVEENLASASGSRVGLLTAADEALIAQVRAKYAELCPIPCTRCRYCMPCPNGVDIPGNFATYNSGLSYDKPDWARSQYVNWIDEKERASACIQCRECESKCPQHIEISQWMPVVHRVLGENQPYICQPD